MKCVECGKHLTNEDDCYGHDCEVRVKSTCVEFDSSEVRGIKDKADFIKKFKEKLENGKKR